MTALFGDYPKLYQLFICTLTFLMVSHMLQNPWVGIRRKGVSTYALRYDGTATQKLRQDLDRKMKGGGCTGINITWGVNLGQLLY